MEFAYSLAMYSPPVRVRPANARRTSSSNTNSYTFVHGANQQDGNNHNQNQKTEDGLEEKVKEKDKNQDNRNSIEEIENNNQPPQQQQKQQQSQQTPNKKSKRKKSIDTSSIRSRIPGRRRPPPAGSLPQPVAHRPASHHSHSRTSSSFSVSTRTSHETQAAARAQLHQVQQQAKLLSQAQAQTPAQAFAQAQTQSTQTQTYPNSCSPCPQTSTLHEHISAKQHSHRSDPTHAASASITSGTLISSSPPDIENSGENSGIGLAIAIEHTSPSGSKPYGGIGASALTTSTASSEPIFNTNINTNTNTKISNDNDGSDTNTTTQTRILDSTVASTSAPAPPPLPVTSASTSTPIASPSPSASTASNVSDSERPASSPKSSRFIRSVHIPIFSTDSGYHHQQPLTASHPPANRLQKRDSLHYRSSIIPRRPHSPTSPLIQAVAGLSSPIRRRTSRGKHHDDAMPPEPSQFVSPQKYIPTSSYRAGSISHPSGLSGRPGIMTSNDNFMNSSTEGSVAPSNSSISTKPSSTVVTKPFIIRNNRTYINEPTLLYPLPVDLAELHRQSLRTLMLFQLFGGPTTAPEFSNKPPTSVLEVGCGAAFWSMMCHRYFAQHGHSSISFTGMDIVPLVGSGLDQNWKPDKDMKWRFVQHDMRRTPWPIPDNEFDLIMVKDMTMCLSTFMRDPQILFEEYLRMLKPGGVLEFWESDHSVRMLRPHVLKAPVVSKASSDSDSSSEEEDETERLGAYIMTNNTPLSAPLNPYLVEYNGWVTKGLDALGVSAVPCTLIGPYLLQEAESLMELRSKRLAVPLSEIRWEREGVGGVVTKDGKSYIDSMKRKGKGTDAKGGGKGLTASQAALRRTALETVVGLILALEPVLREVSGKSQDEWDGWSGKMMNDLLREGGTSWGECLEVGAWSARKKLQG
ncbi:uncharacterized protein F4807DRAFT_23447 [Annulohypoxylon truncatum]|uniref:uncharacterized protein n=1 Tax=Annulohypoxylon truncatum TaxID=327061 RepID=UPI002008493C|nr:uncharacterized protein F4807DRAFT_23447 [Annulohypoxylon truncatum]KAI1215156.1 hypothetical protein F4807DRAFT_23447 [Annulohypoxylon truncatum]